MAGVAGQDGRPNGNRGEDQVIQLAAVGLVMLEMAVGLVGLACGWLIFMQGK